MLPLPLQHPSTTACCLQQGGPLSAGDSAGLAAGASPGRLQPQHACAASHKLQAADQGQEQPQRQTRPWGLRTGYRAATQQEGRLVASLPVLQLPGVLHLVKGLSRDTLTQVGLPLSAPATAAVLAGALWAGSLQLQHTNLNKLLMGQPAPPVDSESSRVMDRPHNRQRWDNTHRKAMGQSPFSRSITSSVATWAPAMQSISAPSVGVQ